MLLALALSAVLHTEAQRVTITRDDWGIAHVHGKTDADAVFGMAYAQAEDDFNRVETNYLTALGRLSEAQGESTIYQDLRDRLFVDPADLQRRYQESPASLRALMNAWEKAGDPHSPHFDDQAQRYTTGDLRPVYFYPDELAGHIERVYHPGE